VEEKMKRMAVLAALAVLIVVASGPALAADDWAGTWKGKGVDSRALGFDITVTVHDDGSALIAYPTEPCEGQLLPMGPWGGSAHLFREKITTGTDICLDGAELALTVGADRVMHYEWRGQDNGELVTAVGMLRRAADPKPIS
jgi:hypothetical protein